MRIVQIHPGLIEIPPRTWGAIEKIIWHCTLELTSRGHVVDILTPDELYHKGIAYDLAHVYTYNQALELAERGIPYVFTCCDHHPVLYGKESTLYQENMEALKRAALGVVPSQFAVEYFESVPAYVPLGFDASFYQPDIDVPRLGLLCVGVNGYCDKPDADRKGFLKAIDLANRVKLDITIAGKDEPLDEFFSHHREYLESPYLTLVHSPSHEELRGLYQCSCVLLHLSELEMGHPPLTLLEAAGCGLPVIATDVGGELLDGQLVYSEGKDLVFMLNTVIRNRSYFSKRILEEASRFTWGKCVDKLEEIYLKSLRKG